MPLDVNAYELKEFFEPSEAAAARQVVRSRGRIRVAGAAIVEGDHAVPGIDEPGQQVGLAIDDAAHALAGLF